MTVYDPLVGPPCGCPECIAAGVEHEQTRRDPDTKEMLHGYALKRGLDAFKAFQEAARAAVGPRTIRGSRGFQKLALRQPGEEG